MIAMFLTPHQYVIARMLRIVTIPRVFEAPEFVSASCGGKAFRAVVMDSVQTVVGIQLDLRIINEFDPDNAQEALRQPEFT
jgi:hypothetical protein